MRKRAGIFRREFQFFFYGQFRTIRTILNKSQKINDILKKKKGKVNLYEEQNLYYGIYGIGNVSSFGL